MLESAAATFHPTTQIRLADQQGKLADYYGELGSQALLDAYGQGPGAYEARASSAITTELANRGLVDGPLPDHRTAIAATAPR